MSVSKYVYIVPDKDIFIFEDSIKEYFSDKAFPLTINGNPAKVELNDAKLSNLARELGIKRYYENDKKNKIQLTKISEARLLTERNTDDLLRLLICLKESASKEIGKCILTKNCFALAKINSDLSIDYARTKDAKGVLAFTSAAALKAYYTNTSDIRDEYALLSVPLSDIIDKAGTKYVEFNPTYEINGIELNIVLTKPIINEIKKG